MRLTASDRPGVAQPVPVRPVPAQPWAAIVAGAVLLALLLVASWEGYWRLQGASAGVRNSDGLWAMQRRRIDAGEGNSTVLIGSSRMLFDLQLPTWEGLAGRRPIQLALEGTSPLFSLEDLAADPNFTGRLLVGVAPDIFFSGFAYRGGILKYYQHEAPSQRAGQWLSMHLFEPYLAFYDPDFALPAVLKRQAWPVREGLPARITVRKLSQTEADRNTQLWRKVETDAAYRALAKRIWAQNFNEQSPKVADKHVLEEQIRRAAAAVARLRARGVPVIFVRAPSGQDYLDFEDRAFPRVSTWDVLLRETGAPGIHFQDHPELRGLDLPEWSHLSPRDAERYTQALYRIVERDHWPAVARSGESERASR